MPVMCQTMDSVLEIQKKYNEILILKDYLVCGMKWGVWG